MVPYTISYQPLAARTSAVDILSSLCYKLERQRYTINRRDLVILVLTRQSFNKDQMNSWKTAASLRKQAVFPWSTRLCSTE